ncbi:MAG: FmdB family zinc ribbon protein [Candidatus Acidiferrales bacterium]
MPIYEYVCDECKSRYERIVTAKNSASACPKCGSARSTIQFSTFAARTGNGSSHSSSASALSDSPSSSGCGCTPHSCGCH